MRRLSIILFFVCLAYQLSAQKYSFIQYTGADGLAQSQVQCVFQDLQGYLWCGTLGGASKFNGREFVNYSAKDGLFGTHINSISQLDDNRIVFGTRGGISILEKDSMQSFLFPGALAEAQVNDMLQLASGDLWIGTNSGLLVFNGSEIVQVDSNHGGYQQNIKKILRTETEKWILVTRDAILEVEGHNTKDIYRASEETILFDAEYDQNGTLWVACKNPGLISIRGGEVKEYSVLDGLISSSMADVLVDSKNNVWLSSIHGVTKFNRSRVVNYTTYSGLPVDDILKTLEDDEGNIWIATQGGGLVKFIGDNFENFTVEDGLCSSAIMSIAEDSLGATWFASYDNAVCRLQNGKFEHFNLDKYTTNNKRFWSSLYDSSGQMWLGSSNNLVRYSNGEFQGFSKDNGLSSSKVLCLHEDSERRLWIGTSSGLNYLDSLSSTKFKNIEALQGIRVRGITSDTSGKLWLASKMGVWCIGNQDTVQYTVDDGLADMSTYCVDVDAYGRVWVGTGGGLCFLDGTTWQTVGTENDLGNLLINFIQCIGDQIWVGSNDGLYRCFLGEYAKADELRFDHYTIEDGLVDLETNLNSAFIDSKNQFWFGTANGLVRVDMDEGIRSPERIKPRIYLTELAINLETPDWKALGVERSVSGTLPDFLEVEHSQNHFTFYFDGISMTYPEDVRYQFMLEGFDRDWQPVTTANFANYSNLPFDEMKFKVRAIGKAGSVSEDASFVFCISPPFWQSWWFIVLSICALVGLVLVVYQRRKRELIIKLEKEKFEYRSKMLLLEQQTLNSSMNRHFIFNALNSIQYYINRQERLSANKYLSAFAKLIRKNLDSSQVNLTSLRDEVERLELYLSLEHMRFQDKFSYRVEVGEDVDLDATKVPAMLLQPFLENSIWHGILPKEEPGEILIRITRSGGSIEFTITDNGIGIETSLRNKQASGSHISQGMSITSSRIELLNKMSGERVELHGPYEVHDAEDAVLGTEVKIILPINFHEIYPN
jgi:ligand-binding sensor domain-containing protein